MRDIAAGRQKCAGTPAVEADMHQSDLLIAEFLKAEIYGKREAARYALVAEIISAVAVVVSLIFVAFQVKDNTAAIRSSTYDGILSDHIEWRMTVASSPELMASILKVDSGIAEVTEVEQANSDMARQGLWQYMSERTSRGNMEF